MLKCITQWLVMSRRTMHNKNIIVGEKCRNCSSFFENRGKKKKYSHFSFCLSNSFLRWELLITLNNFQSAVLLLWKSLNFVAATIIARWNVNSIAISCHSFRSKFEMTRYENNYPNIVKRTFNNCALAVSEQAAACFLPYIN